MQEKTLCKSTNISDMSELLPDEVYSNNSLEILDDLSDIQSNHDSDFKDMWNPSICNSDSFESSVIKSDTSERNATCFSETKISPIDSEKYEFLNDSYYGKPKDPIIGKNNFIKYVYELVLKEQNEQKPINYINQILHEKDEHTFYFDIDKFTGNRFKILKQFKQFLEKIVDVNVTLYTTDSNNYYLADEGKSSSHIYCPTLIGHMSEMLILVEAFHKQIKSEPFDTGVYKNLQNFRVIYQRKSGDKKKGHVTGIHCPCSFNDKGEVEYLKIGLETIYPYIITVNPKDGLRISQVPNFTLLKTTKPKLNNSLPIVAAQLFSANPQLTTIIKTVDFQSKPIEEPIDISIISKLMDKCFTEARIREYKNWIRIGMALYHSYSSTGLDAWYVISKKTSNFEGIEDLRKRWSNFKTVANPLTYKSILNWALEDNKKAYEKIMGKKIENTAQIEQKMAQYLVDNYKDFFWTEDEGETRLYVWNYEEKNWVFDTKGKRSAAMALLDRFLMTNAAVNFKDSEAAIKILGKMSARKNIIEVTSSLTTFKKRIIWEKDPLLLGYDNGVLNILTGEFREKTPQDFIKMSVKRNYELDKMPQDVKARLVEEVWRFIKSIFYKQDIREYMLKVFSTCLYGKTMEHFYFLTGCGGNGKSALNDLIMKALGDYAILANNSLLTDSQDNKSNPFLAALENKRAIFFREPKKNKPISNTNVKDLTGSDIFATRDLYQDSKQTQKHNCGTYFCECNQKPLLEDEANYAEKRRIRDVLFGTRFVENELEVDEAEGVFLANPMFKDRDWQLSVSDILIEILIGYFQEIYKDKCKIAVPEEVTKRSIAYMAESSMILTWLTENYTKQDKEIPLAEQNRIPVAELYKDLVSSLPINQNEKRTKNQSWLKKELLNNFELKQYFFERKQFGAGDNKEQVCSTLFGWVKKNY